MIDLRGLTSMDSTGLHLLLRAERRRRDLGLCMMIVRGDEPITRLFELTGVERLLPLVDRLRWPRRCDRGPRSFAIRLAAPGLLGGWRSYPIPGRAARIAWSA